MKHLLSALLVFTLFVSCSKDSEDDYVTQNEQEIKNYIAEKKLTAIRSDSGLYYVINDPGTGTQPTATSTVTVAYKGYYSNGTSFDPGSTTGITFSLNEVISGWTEGIQYFKTGGSGILLVPAHLGYGNSNYNGIPGGSVLIFDVKLISVK